MQQIYSRKTQGILGRAGGKSWCGVAVGDMMRVLSIKKYGMTQIKALERVQPRRLLNIRISWILSLLVVQIGMACTQNFMESEWTSSFV